MSEESGIKFTGKAPPAFYESLKEVKQQPQEEKVCAVPPKPTKSQKKQSNSLQLDELLALTKDHSYIYDEIKLPSMGVFYNGKDGPEDGILHIRPMTGEEEQILAQPRYVNKGVAIDMIFQKCIKQTYRTNEYLSIDRTYLLIWLRGISYGHEYDVEVRCPECGKKFPYTINLSDLDVNYCPATIKPPLMDVLPKSNFKFTWHFPKGRDESLITNYKDKQAREYGESGNDDSFIYRIALMLDDIEGLSDKTELMILLKKMHIQDVSYLKNLVNEPPFGVDTNCPITCMYCVHDFEVDLPLEAGFFSPRPKKTRSDSGNT